MYVVHCSRITVIVLSMFLCIYSAFKMCCAYIGTCLLCLSRAYVLHIFAERVVPFDLCIVVGNQDVLACTCHYYRIYCFSSKSLRKKLDVLKAIFILISLKMFVICSVIF